MPLLCGCTQTQVAQPANPAVGDAEADDPHEGINRDLFAANDALDRNIIKPVAVGYVHVAPSSVRQHVHNVLSNLGNPAQLANDVLQAKPRKAGNTLMRLLINTTLGVGGIFDVAKTLHFPDHDTDFGLTLAVWGVPEGPYLYLPIIGPSDPRDAIGYGANSALDPFTWVSFGGSATFGLTRFGVAAIDGRSRYLGTTDTIDKTALDRYATYRSLYRQHRAAVELTAVQDLPSTTPDWYPTPQNAETAASTGVQTPPAISPSPSTLP